MKKEFIVGAIAIVACFSLVGCGEKKENTNENSGTNTEVNEVKTNNVESNETEEVFDKIELISDDTKMVFKLSDTVSAVYYYSGDKITGYEAYAEYDTPELANLAKATYDGTEDDDIESITVRGNTLVAKYKPAVYEDMTVSELKATYELIQQIQSGELGNFTEEE